MAQPPRLPLGAERLKKNLQRLEFSSCPTSCPNTCLHVCFVCKVSEHHAVSCPKHNCTLHCTWNLPHKPNLWPPAIEDFSFQAVDLRKRLCDSPVRNAFSYCVHVPSNLHISVWHYALTSYYDKEIVDFLGFGLAINYTAAHFPTSVSQNHPSACKHSGHVRDFINREVNLHATAGPFLSHPLDCGIMLSPLLTVPKKNSNTHRVVMDLSFPHSCSVNDGIPRGSYFGDSFHLHLPGVDALVTFVQKFVPWLSAFQNIFATCSQTATNRSKGLSFHGIPV